MGPHYKEWGRITRSGAALQGVGQDDRGWVWVVCRPELVEGSLRFGRDDKGWVRMTGRDRRLRGCGRDDKGGLQLQVFDNTDLVFNIAGWCLHHHNIPFRFANQRSGDRGID